jgi:glycosyltransferase involved in cell wall biosynthesis
MTTISIVLLSQHFELFKQCLASIQLHTADSYELIVINDGGILEISEWLEQHAPDAILLSPAPMLGVAAGYNLGASHSRGESIVFIRDHVTVTKHWLEALTDCMQANPKAAMVGPLSHNVSGLQNAPIPSRETLLKDAASAQDLLSFGYASARRTTRLLSFLLLMRRDTFDSLGGFDERFALEAYEDDDLCYRALQAGYTLQIAYDCFVHYTYPPQLFPDDPDWYQRQIIMNRFKALNKWGFDLAEAQYAIKTPSLVMFEHRVDSGEALTPHDLYRFANELADDWQWERAAECYERFLGHEEGDIEDRIAIYGRLADCYSHLNRMHDAKSKVLQSFCYALPRAENCCRLGMLYMKEHDFTSAAWWYKLATELTKPMEPTAIVRQECWSWLPYLQLCACYIRLGGYQLAYRYNEIAAAFIPDHHRVRANRAYLASHLEPTSADTSTFTLAQAVAEQPIPSRPQAGQKTRITLSMVVKNESGRYLKQALERHRLYIDDAVIIDDGSTDDTIDICLQALTGIPVKLIRNEVSKFSNEITLRKQQWEETLSVNPQWILNLDADEWFEDRFTTEIRQLLDQSNTHAISFRLYDFWTNTAYREDNNWQAHLFYRPFLLRYNPDFTYVWKETPQHCGRFPENIYQLPNELSNLRLKHFGWVNVADRLQKFNRYMLLDPDAVYGLKEQYLSIIDSNPHLIEWVE